MNIIEVLLLVVAILIGWLVSSNKHRRFAFFKALILLLFMIILSTAIFAGILYGILRMDTLISNISIRSLFTIVFLIMVISGFILYFFLCLILRNKEVSSTTVTLIEYYIQWSLIYVTIYQVAFDKLIKLDQLSKIIQGSPIDPTILIILILPSFISCWMAVIFYKVHNNEI